MRPTNFREGDRGKWLAAGFLASHVPALSEGGFPCAWIDEEHNSEFSRNGLDCASQRTQSLDGDAKSQSRTKVRQAMLLALDTILSSKSDMAQDMQPPAAI
jgi:hypothetical protein